MKSTHTSITTLPDSPELDRAHRLSRYVWQMAIRVVLFVVAVLVYSIWHSWIAVVPIVLAAVIPWVAVIVANAGSRTESDMISPPVRCSSTTRSTPASGSSRKRTAPRPTATSRTASGSRRSTRRTSGSATAIARRCGGTADGGHVRPAHRAGLDPVCSRAGCSNTAAWRVNWRNPGSTPPTA